MTKERLRAYQSIKREREQILQRLEEVETALYYPKVQQLDAMPGSGTKEGNPQENLAIYHIELQDLYKAKLAEMAAEQLAIEKAIEPLEPTARMLLRYRYLDGLKWEEVCCRLNYSWRQTHRLHGEALQKLREE
jgi:DNA-directed RNA polymerase specialized sigma24 family protein